MSRLGELGIIDGISVRFLHTCNLVVADGIKLIISDWCNLSLELIKADADVLVIQLLQVNRICGVVDQYIRINTCIYQVDDIILDHA